MNTINDFNFKNKRAIIRVDFNVPLDGDRKVTDNSRIVGAKPTILKILEDGGSAVLMSHLGRPEGKEGKYSLQHIVAQVSEVLGVRVKFAPDCRGEEVQAMANKLTNGEVLLIENLRFTKKKPKETKHLPKS